MDIFLYGESLQSHVGPLEPIVAKGMPPLSACDRLVGDLEDSHVIYNLGEHDRFCTRTDEGSIAAVRVDKYSNTTEGPKVELSYAAYEP